MKVTFSTADEFLEELTKACAGTAGPYAIEDQILRLTFRYEQSKAIPIVHMSVVAGVVVRGKIIELTQYVGQVMDMPAAHEGSDTVRQKAAALKCKIEEQARALDLDIRAGMFET